MRRGPTPGFGGCTTVTALPMAFLVAFGGMVAASATSLVGLWAGLELAALKRHDALGAVVADHDVGISVQVQN